jgi:hypothetical protein
LGSEIAQAWASRYDYPLESVRDLSRVAQFIAVTEGGTVAAELLARQMADVMPPNLDNPDEPYRVLADLPFSMYITTNFDDFLVRALDERHKEPHRELCRWNRLLKSESSLLSSDYDPGPANPMVFHLQGALDVPESLVLTEDDYLDFLVNVARDEDAFPRVVQKACAGTLLLFLGLRLDDWNFRILYKGLSGFIERSVRRGHVAVMLPLSTGDSREEMRDFERYFQRSDLRIYWGSVQEFTSELKHRMEQFNSGA